MKPDYRGAEETARSLLKTLPKKLCYHNWDHTERVVRAAAMLGRYERIAHDESTIVKTAALFHDTGFLVRYEDNEEEGAKIAGTYLPSLGYSPKDIRRIQKMILSTRVVYDKSMPVQKPGIDILNRILCDSDMHILGMKGYYEVSLLLRKELLRMGRKIGIRQWRIIQLNFLKSHRFFTEGATKRWDRQLKRNIMMLEASFKDIVQSDCSRESRIVH